MWELYTRQSPRQTKANRQEARPVSEVLGLRPDTPSIAEEKPKKIEFQKGGCLSPAKTPKFLSILGVLGCLECTSPMQSYRTAAPVQHPSRQKLSCGQK